MAKKRVPERGSEEERRYYLTKEGLKDFDSYKEFDWRRALELLFEDAPDVNWWDCSANDFKELRDKGVITEEECDLALSIGSRMLSQALHFPETPLFEKDSGCAVRRPVVDLPLGVHCTYSVSVYACELKITIMTDLR